MFKYWLIKIKFELSCNLSQISGGWAENVLKIWWFENDPKMNERTFSKKLVYSLTEIISVNLKLNFRFQIWGTVSNSLKLTQFLCETWGDRKLLFLQCRDCTHYAAHCAYNNRHHKEACVIYCSHSTMWQAAAPALGPGSCRFSG